MPPPSAPYHFEARAWRTGVVRVAGAKATCPGDILQVKVTGATAHDLSARMAREKPSR